MKLTLPFFGDREQNSAEQKLGQRSSMLEYDQALVWVTMLLLLIGLIMVYSASINLTETRKYKDVSSHYFLARQSAYILIGLFSAVLAFRVRIEQWEKFAPYLFIGVLLLMIVVLELMMVIYAADFTVRKQQYMHKLSKGFLPMAGAVGLATGLLMMQPDLGAAGVVVCIAMGILFLGGFNIVWFSGIAGVLAAVFSLIILFSPWRRERLTAYLDPWADGNVLGKAYQLSHSLIAFGRGELFGVGLGGSVEKLHYLPEAHTDFLMAVIGEELGLAGVLVVTFLFYFIVRRSFDIGRQAIATEKFFAGLVAKGIGIWIGVQAFINMGVNLGLLPTKGLTLPLMSFGGSGIVTNCIGIAILLRIDYENRVLMRGGRA